jgi:hypothetical protein
MFGFNRFSPMAKALERVKSVKSRRDLVKLLKTSTLFPAKLLLRLGADILFKYFECISSGADIISVQHGKVLKKINITKEAVQTLLLVPETKALLDDPNNTVLVLVVRTKMPGEYVTYESWATPLGKMTPFVPWKKKS